MKFDFTADIPAISEKRLAVRVTKDAERHIRKGHPWIFDQSITNISQDGRAGDLAVVFDSKKRFLAIGLFDPDSPIRIKLLHIGKPTKVDDQWFADRVVQAAALRLPLAGDSQRPTNGYRLMHGENDGIPGLVIDRYAGTMVVKLYSAALIPHLAVILDSLMMIESSHGEVQRIVLRLSRLLQARPDQLYGLRDGQLLWGMPFDASDGSVTFLEDGLTLAADVLHGHKTGYFFDHRHNRRRVGKLARGKNVLDVFAYAGGFSLQAARGGARYVSSLDISQPALGEAISNFARNAHIPEVAACQHETIMADAFKGLADLHEAGRLFDIVVVDPPSFAKSQREVDAAVAKYRQLTKLALNVLKPEGVLVIASCSSRVSAELFFANVFDAADEIGRPLWEQARTFHDIDHPIRPSFSEGAYLKCLFATTID